MYRKFPRILLPFVFVSMLFVAGVFAQEEVEILQKVGSKRFDCYPTQAGVIDQAGFEKLKAAGKCTLISLLDVDFSKHTLIYVSTGGDCHLRVRSRVFRSDREKTFDVKIYNYYGGCRAGGFFQGLLVIDKIPAGYEVKMEVIRIDRYDESEVGDDLLFRSSLYRKKSAAEPVESVEAYLKGCIQTYRQKTFVIRTKEDYLASIRKDAQAESCRENAEQLEFEKYSYLGLEINSGYCRRPLGLEQQVTRDASKKEFVLNVSYLDPGDVTCRALSQYDFWVRIPKIPADYTVDFKVAPKLPDGEN
jgi:hypothetical protein